MPNRLYSLTTSPRPNLSAFVMALGLIGADPAGAGRQPEHLMDMSLESLMAVEIASVARQSETLAETAASVYVISREEIRRSGATTVPDALRLAPGLEIRAIDANKTAMAIRGFNSGASSNKLLVMIDGRTIYTSLLSGVFWEHHDLMLADIDRIEVVRGPGATMWGANAVNGVINIITRDSSETQGALFEAVAGSDPTGRQAALRHGGAIGGDIRYRWYGRYLDRGDFRMADGRADDDGRTVAQFGARMDWRPRPGDHVTVQGDYYDGHYHQTLYDAPTVLDPDTFLPISGTTHERGQMSGGNFIARWQRDLAGGGSTALQFYYDRFERNDSVAPHSTDTWDLDFQHRLSGTDSIGLIWGAGYRHVAYQFDPQPHIVLEPASGDIDTISAFAQIDYQLTPELKLSAGTKFEYNELTEFEYQPTIRMLWRATERQTAWGSISRAIRTPSLMESFSRSELALVPSEPSIRYTSFGNTDLDHEDILVYEAGYRAQISPGFSFDASLYFNDYDNLVNSEFDPTPYFTESGILFRYDFRNNLRGETYGLDLSAEWHPMERWRLVAGYSTIRFSLETKRGSSDTATAPSIEASSPRHQLQLRSYVDLGHDLEFDVSAFWTSRLPGNEALFLEEIDSHLRLDLHLGWQPHHNVSLGLFVHDALSDQNVDFRHSNTVRGEVPRSVFGRLRVNW